MPTTGDFADNLFGAARATFINHHGRLRSGWRLSIFIVLSYLALMFAFSALEFFTLLLAGDPERGRRFLSSAWGNFSTRLILLMVATLVGWVCGLVLESLPPRALGWALHRGWWRDFLVGSLLGAASLALAVGFGAAFGGYRFSLNAADALPAVLKTLVLVAGFFVVAGAAEEVTARGYPLQTLLRSLPAWVPVLLTSVLFSAGHLMNPNVVPGFTFFNTLLAGVWLAVAYLRTRSLWFPLGIHWAWNWALASLFGLPVSGISFLSQTPLVSAQDQGPAWLTGGAYGIEGGAAGTVALLISTVFIWRTRLVGATEEMRHYTDEEIPDPRFTRPTTLSAEGAAGNSPAREGGER